MLADRANPLERIGKRRLWYLAFLIGCDGEAAALQAYWGILEALGLTCIALWGITVRRDWRFLYTVV